MIKVDLSLAAKQLKLTSYEEKAKSAFTSLTNGDAKMEMTGWVNLPINYDVNEVNKIKEVAREIRENAKVLVVIGIGGSYLGAKAGIDFLSNYYRKEGELEVIFAGNGLSEKYLYEALEYVKDKDFYINVISKSGGTLEPAVAFRFFRELAEKKYGKDASKRIIATTDKEKGILKNIADSENYRQFVIPDDIGGRYSVLTPVGLLPIAAAGFDIDKILLGAKEIKERLSLYDNNDAVAYAKVRNALYDNGKDIEVFSTMQPNMRFFSEWLKQLFGESECKENKGIFPASLTLTSDLHSMGQLMQEGKRNMFETFINLEEDFVDNRLKIQEKEVDDDKLNYLKDTSLNKLNDVALKATMKAHNDGDVPAINISINRQNEKTLGEIFYFFEFACGLSALILGVNPFNQPGVEAYKSNIKELLK